METKRIPILGLNYRIADHEAPGGICRALSDLYPSGEAASPSWRPARAAGAVLTNNKDMRILSAYVWHRANLPSALLVLATSDQDGLDFIASLPLDGQGNVPPYASAEKLYSFTDGQPARMAYFAQAGENVVATVLTDGRADRMFWIKVVEDAAVCLNFNPTIPFPRLTLAGDGDSAKNSGLIATYPTVYFGVRMAWELIDGTLLGVSGLLIFPVAQAGGKWPKMKFQVAAPVAYSDTNWTRMVRGVALYISPYVGSTAAMIPETIARESSFHRFALLEGAFTGTPAYTFDEDWDTITALERLETDLVLSRKTMTARTLFSYNKRLLYGGVEYTFIAPARLDGKAQTSGDDVVAPPNRPAPLYGYERQITIPATGVYVGANAVDEIYRYTFSNALNWLMPPTTPLDKFKWVVVERRILYTKRDYVDGVPNPGMVDMVFNHVDVRSEWEAIARVAATGAVATDEYTDAATFDAYYFAGVFEDIYNIRIEYRIYAEYTDGASAKVPVTIPASPMPLPAENLSLVVSGGLDFTNDEIPADVYAGAQCNLSWLLPTQDRTMLEIGEIRIERTWQYKLLELIDGDPLNTDPANIRTTPKLFDLSQIAVLPPGSASFIDEVRSPAPHTLKKGDSIVDMSITYRVLIKYITITTPAGASVTWSAP